MTITSTKVMTKEEVYEAFNGYLTKWGREPISRTASNDFSSPLSGPFWGSEQHWQYIVKVIGKSAVRRQDNEMLFQLISSSPWSNEWLAATEAVRRNIEIAHDAFEIFVHIYAITRRDGRLSEISEDIRSEAKGKLDAFAY